MKVKNFLTLPSGTLIRKSSVIGVFAFEERRMIIVETESGREYPVEVKDSKQFWTIQTDLASQLNEE